MTTFITEYPFPLITKKYLKLGVHTNTINEFHKKRPPHTDSKLHESRSKTGREVSFIMS